MALIIYLKIQKKTKNKDFAPNHQFIYVMYMAT